jgi:hypothetical protein
MKRIVTRALIILAATLAIVFIQFAPASADPPDDPPGILAGNLAELWTTVLETPASDFPVDGGCWDLGHGTVAPFFGGTNFSCTVEAGTKLFVVGFSFECSSIPGDDGEPPFTPKNLRECAVSLNKDKDPTVTLDGNTSVPLTGVVTPALKIDLPEDNIFGPAAPPDKYRSVAHGWVALLPALPPGTHTIIIVSKNPDGTTTTNTTTINVVGPAPA